MKNKVLLQGEPMVGVFDLSCGNSKDLFVLEPVWLACFWKALPKSVHNVLHARIFTFTAQTTTTATTTARPLLVAAVTTPATCWLLLLLLLLSHLLVLLLLQQPLNNHHHYNDFFYYLQLPRRRVGADGMDVSGGDGNF